jgi:hypothetical protein
MVPVTIVRTMIKALVPGNILTAAISSVEMRTSIEITTLLEARIPSHVLTTATSITRAILSKPCTP